MIESKLVLDCLEYNPIIYENIIQHGRLAPVDLGKLKSLSDEEAHKNASGLIDFLLFSNNQVFDTKDLGRILQVHTPLDANAYHERCEDNILSLDFYKI